MHRALYRKYRPTSFVNFVGQQEIKTTLINALNEKKTSHAYLFAGPRGTGKTSAAKLLAKAVNCENFKEDICDECNSCKIANDSIDIIEIDAASNNGVDEIRELRSKINLVPTELKFKVYIIDEVHMLTTGAFNALLKTLEEPPSHVMFILATTELYKVPITIVSRCQTFNFKRITNDDIIDRLNFIVKEEKINVEDEVIEKIANMSNGGLRDAIGLLDKISSISTDKLITVEQFEEINGFVNDNDIKLLINLILENKDKELVNELSNLNSEGKNISDLLTQMLIILRNELFEDHVYSNYELKNKYIDVMQIINDVITSSTEKNILLNFEIKILSFMKKNNVKEEVMVITKEEQIISQEIISKEPTKKIETKLEKVIKKPETNKVNVKKSENIEINRDKLYEQLKEIRINNVFSKADKKHLVDIVEKWDNITTLDFNNNSDKKIAFLLDSKPVAASDDHLIIEFDYESLSDKCMLYLENIEKKLKKDYDISHKIIALTKDEWNIEKNRYIENLKQKVTYEIKDDNKILDELLALTKQVNLKEMNPILNKVISIVGEDIVNIE